MNIKRLFNFFIFGLLFCIFVLLVTAIFWIVGNHAIVKNFDAKINFLVLCLTVLCFIPLQMAINNFVKTFKASRKSG